MNRENYFIWKDFRKSIQPTISNKEFKMIANFHSIYFKHQYFLPCTCSPKTIISWIKQLNELFLSSKKYRLRK